MFSVLVKHSSVVEVVSVLLRDLNLCKTCGFLDDGLVKDGVIESGLVSGRVGVFFGQGLWVCGTMGESNGEKPVVVLVVVPVPKSKFTLAGNVVKELSEFGSSAVFSGDHAILGRAKVELVVDGGWVSFPGGKNMVRREELEVNSVWLVEVCVHVVVWVTVVLNENCLDEKGWFVLPFVVY